MALNSQLLTVQILTNNVQVLILCLSYLITTVLTVLDFDLFLAKYLDISTLLFVEDKQDCRKYSLESSFMLQNPLCQSTFPIEKYDRQMQTANVKR